MTKINNHYLHGRHLLSYFQKEIVQSIFLMPDAQSCKHSGNHQSIFQHAKNVGDYLTPATEKK